MHVLQAAVQDISGLIYTMRRPARHHNILHAMSKVGHKRVQQAKQGFLRSDGEFLNREQAATLAIESGEIEKLNYCVTDLFSEDLW